MAGESTWRVAERSETWESLEKIVSDAKQQWLGVIGSQNTDMWGEEHGLSKAAPLQTCLCPLPLAVLKIFNAEEPFHIARCSFSAPFMQALSPKWLHRDWHYIMGKENLVMIMRNFYSHLKAVSSGQREMKQVEDRASLWFCFCLMKIPVLYLYILGSNKGEENRLPFFLSYDSRKAWIISTCNFSKGSASGRKQNLKIIGPQEASSQFEVSCNVKH